jgi:hypothetical protein
MTNWTKAVTHPLGLAAFALALVFGLLGTYGAMTEHRWLLYTSVGLAAFTLIGGLTLAFYQSSNQKKRPSKSPIQEGASVGDVFQESSRTSKVAKASFKGNNNTNIQNADGDVKIQATRHQ